jgi:signal peptidase I
MKLKSILTFFVVLIFTTNNIAQIVIVDSTSNNENTTKGELIINQSSSIDSLLNTDKKNQKFKAGFNGYRIQIFSGTSVEKNKAIEIKAKFNQLFPDQRSYLEYKAPNFRVKVGNFRTKTSAMYMLSKVKAQFSNSYLVKSLIRFSEIKPKEEISEIDTEENQDESQADESVIETSQN